MDEKDKITEQMSDIVTAYRIQHSLPSIDLPALIKSVHSASVNLREPLADTSQMLRQPAVTVKKSIQPDFIICLEDGLKFKSLKRHLLSKYGMSPDEYRAKWGLPKDYPMVAPAYSASRSALAKKMGLGSPRTVAKAVPTKARKTTAKVTPSK